MTITIPLSSRERQVIDHLARDLSYKEVATVLNISFGTVQTHIKRSFCKLGANSKLSAIRNLQLIERGQRPGKKTSSRIPVLA